MANIFLAKPFESYIFDPETITTYEIDHINIDKVEISDDYNVITTYQKGFIFAKKLKYSKKNFHLGNLGKDMYYRQMGNMYINKEFITLIDNNMLALTIHDRFNPNKYSVYAYELERI